MDETLTSLISEKLPRLAELLGDHQLGARDEEFQRLGMVPLWQVEQDLELLTRYVPWTRITSAYQALLRNPGHFIEAMYEIRVAALLAPFVDELELAPTIGAGCCDLACTIRGEKVFVEVTTHTDKFPPAYDGNVYGRATVEKSFDPTGKVDDPSIRTTPASKELKDRILDEIPQLPSGEVTVLVVGAPGGRSLDMESTLWGDEILRAHEGTDGWWRERVENGLFQIPDEVGGTSRLSAVVWMKLAPRFCDVRVYSRLFVNPLAARPFPHEVEERFRSVFDRGAVLRGELDRIEKILREEYHPTRIILFGSLAEELANPVDKVHQWSDIDLVIVKSSSFRFTDRIREVMDLVRPRVSLNLLVYTPEEFAHAEHQGSFFLRDEILKKGRTLFP